jgi:MinD superfamily P-loop ATPase
MWGNNGKCQEVPVNATKRDKTQQNAINPILCVGTKACRNVFQVLAKGP